MVCKDILNDLILLKKRVDTPLLNLWAADPCVATGLFQGP